MENVEVKREGDTRRWGWRVEGKRGEEEDERGMSADERGQLCDGSEGGESIRSRVTEGSLLAGPGLI